MVMVQPAGRIAETGATTSVVAAYRVVRGDTRPGPAAPVGPDPALRRQRRTAFYAERAGEWDRLFTGGFASLSTDAALDLRTRLQDVATQAEQRVATIDPKRNAVELKTWLDETLTAAVADSYGAAVDAVRELSICSARHFRLDDSEVIDPPPCRVRSDLDTASLATAGDRSGSLSSGVNILMRAYMGFMIFFVLTGTMGLKASSWLGVLPVLLLGGVALHEERRRRLGVRRSRADAAVAEHIGAVGDAAAREIRELVRRLEEGLGGAYRSRIDRLVHTPDWR